MKIIMCLCSLLVLVGCTTMPIDKPLPPIVFEKETPYILDTAKIQETDPPNWILLMQEPNGGFRLAKGVERPTHMALLQSDLVKIDALVQVKKGYKKMAEEQEMLVNIERAKCDTLKEMLVIERQSRQIERELRLDVEKSYAAERRDHKIDNFINKATWVVTVVGGVAIAAL